MNRPNESSQTLLPFINPKALYTHPGSCTATVLAAGVGALEGQVPVIREESAVAGGEIMIVQTPRHAGGLVQLRRCPHLVSIGRVFLVEDTLAAVHAIIVAEGDIAAPLVEGGGFVGVARAIQRDGGVYAVARPDERIRAVVHAGDDRPRRGIDVQRGDQQRTFEQCVVLRAWANSTVTPDAKPVRPIRFRRRLGGRPCCSRRTRSIIGRPQKL